MKRLFWLLTFSVLINLSVGAQEKTFLRFYDFSGHKFEKGQVVTFTDSSIVVFRDSALIQIPISSIASIKTKRSYGHNALVSSFALAVTGVIIGYAIGDPKSNSNNYSFGDYSSKDFTTTTGAFLGGFSGILTGAVISGSSQKFMINGDVEIWKQIRGKITLKKKAES